MGQKKDEMIQQLLATKAYMGPMLEEKKNGVIFKGEQFEFEVDGETRTAMSYGSNQSLAPVYFDIHGGGYAWGSITDGDEYCSLLAEKLGYRVYSIDYPLAPECQYPCQLEYVYRTILYFVEHAQELNIDKKHLIIGGRSAGGNLAAALCIYAATKGKINFKAQVLDHPWLDLSGTIPWNQRCADPVVLPQFMMEMLSYGYADTELWNNPLVSPMMVKDSIAEKLPKAVIQTAEIDSLEVEGRAYAEKLKKNGVSVIFRCAKGATHGFTEEYTSAGQEGRVWLVDSLKRLLDK